MRADEVPWKLQCVRTGATYSGLEVRYRSDEGETLDVVHDFEAANETFNRDTFDQRLASKSPLDRSGVWRFRELILPVSPDLPVTKPEGNTNVYHSNAIADFVGLESFPLKHEGENPTGSFKDRGMTVGITVAKMLGMHRVACASTGNTSASMAAYAAQAGMQAFVFVPEGNIAYGKLSQALAYGAITIQLTGNFDRAMHLVQEVCAREGIYLLNSVNPFRIEGQKAIGFELLQDLHWEVPDWIVLPGGNLGNNVALSKGLLELRDLGIIDKVPRIAVIQAAGANPLYRAYRDQKLVEPLTSAETIATAIRIGDPVSWRKSQRGLDACDGVVEEVTDQEILDAKAQVDAAGIGAEPASCTTVAGARKLVASGAIDPAATVCGILTGHLLKDSEIVVGYHRDELNGFDSRFANAPIQAPAELSAIIDLVRTVDA